MPTSTITGTIIDGAGTPVAGVAVYARLRPYNGARLSDGSTVTNPPAATTNGSGVYSFVLEQQANIVPAGSWWELEEDTSDLAGGRSVKTINVGSSPATVGQSEVTPLALLGPSALTQAQGDARYLAQGSFVISVKNSLYGAKGDGVTDDTAAINSAIAVALLVGGIVFFPPGTYKVGTSLTQITTLSVSLEGAGSQATKLLFTAAAGECIKFKQSPFNSALPGGHIAGMTIDGAGNTATGIVGLHLGDAVGLITDDVVVQNFVGTNAIGVWLNNTAGWFERSRLDLTVNNCTQCYVFSVNAGNASFGYNEFRLRSEVNAGQKAIVSQNDALVYNSVVDLVCNVADAGIVASIGGTSAWQANRYYVVAEQTSGVGGQGFLIASGASLWGYGVIRCPSLPHTNSNPAGTSSGLTFRLFGSGEARTDSNDNDQDAGTVADFLGSGAAASIRPIVASQLTNPLAAFMAALGTNIASPVITCFDFGGRNGIIFAKLAGATAPNGYTELGHIDTAGTLSVIGDLTASVAGKGVRVKEGVNAKMGAAALVAGTVTVATTAVTATSRILLTAQALGTVTAAKALAVTARTAGTSFTVTSADGTDTSVVAWMIVEPA